MIQTRGLDARPAVRRHRPHLGDAEPEHADAGHRTALPGHVPVRGDQHVRGPRDDPAVRADRRAVHRLPLGAGAADEERSRASRSARPTSRRRSARTPTCCAAVSRCRSPTRPKVEAITAATHMIVEATEALPGLRLAGREPARPLDRPAHRIGPVPDHAFGGCDRRRDRGSLEVRDRRVDRAPRQVPAVQGSAPVKRCLVFTIASAVMLTMASPAVAHSNKSGRFDQPVRRLRAEDHAAA